MFLYELRDNGSASEALFVLQNALDAPVKGDDFGPKWEEQKLCLTLKHVFSLHRKIRQPMSSMYIKFSVTLNLLDASVFSSERAAM